MYDIVYEERIRLDTSTMLEYDLIYSGMICRKTKKPNGFGRAKRSDRDDFFDG